MPPEVKLTKAEAKTILERELKADLEALQNMSMSPNKELENQGISYLPKGIKRLKRYLDIQIDNAAQVSDMVITLNHLNIEPLSTFLGDIKKVTESIGPKLENVKKTVEELEQKSWVSLALANSFSDSKDTNVITFDSKYIWKRLEKQSGEAKKKGDVSFQSIHHRPYNIDVEARESISNLVVTSVERKKQEKQEKQEKLPDNPLLTLKADIAKINTFIKEAKTILEKELKADMPIMENMSILPKEEFSLKTKGVADLPDITKTLKKYLVEKIITANAASDIVTMLTRVNKNSTPSLKEVMKGAEKIKSLKKVEQAITELEEKQRVYLTIIASLDTVQVNAVGDFDYYNVKRSLDKVKAFDSTLKQTDTPETLKLLKTTNPVIKLKKEIMQLENFANQLTSCDPKPFEKYFIRAKYENEKGYFKSSSMTDIDEAGDVVKEIVVMKSNNQLYIIKNQTWESLQDHIKNQRPVLAQDEEGKFSLVKYSSRGYENEMRIVPSSENIKEFYEAITLYAMPIEMLRAPPEYSDSDQRSSIPESLSGPRKKTDALLPPSYKHSQELTPDIQPEAPPGYNAVFTAPTMVTPVPAATPRSSAPVNSSNPARQGPAVSASSSSSTSTSSRPRAIVNSSLNSTNSTTPSISPPTVRTPAKPIARAPGTTATTAASPRPAGASPTAQPAGPTIPGSPAAGPRTPRTGH